MWGFVLAQEIQVVLFLHATYYLPDYLSSWCDFQIGKAFCNIQVCLKEKAKVVKQMRMVNGFLISVSQSVMCLMSSHHRRMNAECNKI